MTTTVEAPSGGASRAVAREIRAEMGRQQRSRAWLARRLDVSDMWVSRRLSDRGDVHLTLEEIQTIADALGVSAFKLVSAGLPPLDSNQQPAGNTARLRLVA